MMKTNKTLCVLGCTLLLAACGMSQTKGPDGSVGFPDIKSASLQEGIFVNVANLRQMGPGLTKDQVYALLGAPHFNEGVIAVHVWNYIFDFRSEPGNQVVSCQYQVLFDEHYKVKETYWKDPGCAKFLDEKKEPPAAPVMPPEQPKLITLDSSVLFAFDKSGLGDLRQEGQARLDDIAKSLVADDAHIRGIQINGYTDRIGTEAYNQHLSAARAQTVRSYLVSRGVAADKVRAAGLGSAFPISTGCPAGRSPSVIACLAPDRRVTIEVIPMDRQ